MSKRPGPIILALAAALSLGGAIAQPVVSVLAQDATPAAEVPPQTLLPADADYGTGKTAQINGVDIYYEVHGEEKGDPIILLHGGLSNGDHFVNQIPVLAENHEVVVRIAAATAAPPSMTRPSPTA